MKENLKIGLIIAVCLIPVAFLMFCGMTADGTIPLLRWDSGISRVLLVEGETAKNIDCLHQAYTFTVGGELIFDGDPRIGELWTVDGRMVEVNAIPDGTKVAIYEKKFWWMHRHFIVCEE